MNSTANRCWCLKGALMKMAGKEFAIKKNDLIFIPKGTVHSVKNTGKDPLRILSVQSPYFDGKDRVMVEE